MAGIVVSIVIALSPFRFSFLEEVPLFGSLNLDMAMHVLSFAWYTAWLPMVFKTRTGVALAALAVFQGGVVIEFLQMHIPYHRFSEIDILSNGVGCACGTLAGLLIRRRCTGRRD